MKLLRLLTKFLIWAGVLVALLTVISIAPVLQTWVAQKVLARQPSLHGSIGALEARFGRVQIADLHLEGGGVVFTMPYLEARLPLTTAVWTRKIAVRNLVAKGWTLDLRHSPDAADAPTPVAAVPEHAEGAGTLPAPTVAPAQRVLRAFRGILGIGRLPCDLSLDGVDLEGDVIVAASPGNPPDKIHVVIKGDGVAAGREGVLAIDAAGEIRDTWLGTVDLAAQGRLLVTMDSPRTLSRVGIKADLTADGRSLPKGFTSSIDFAVARGAGEETYFLDLSRDSQRLASVLLHAPVATDQLIGKWKIDLRESDLAAFVADRALPTIAAEGEGDVDADTALTRVHALGRLKVVTSRWGVLTPPLDALGTLTSEVRFDLVHSGRSLRIDRLNVSSVGTDRAAVVQSLQSFEFDERTGHLAVTDPRTDWLEASIGAFPLTGLKGNLSGFTFTGGKAKGEFLVRAADGGFAVRSKTPVTAADVGVQRADKVVGRGLDVSLSLLADYAPSGWQLECAPLVVGSAGQNLVTIAAKTSRPAKAGAPIAITGKWNADLKALASQSAIPGTGWITARSASGEFSASIAEWAKVEGKLAVVGSKTDHSISLDFQADVGANLAISFHAPIKIAVGSSVSELSADGAWSSETAADRIRASLTGKKVALEHLQLLAAPLAAMGGASWGQRASVGSGGPQTAPDRHDRIPFWGDWVGSVAVAFDCLRAGDQDLNDVRGAFDIEHGSIRLQNGIWVLPDQSLAKVEGSISFDAAAQSPYSLKAKAALGEVDAAPVFGVVPAGRDLVFKGRFTVATTLTGNGSNLDDLVGRIEQEFRLTSTNGIVRLLKTNVADSVPEAAAPVSDALVTAGTLVGKVFGMKPGSIGPRENRVSKNTEAVLDFTYLIAEIGYDQITITTTRGIDRAIRLTEIAMTSRDVSVTGSGQIAFVKGLSFAAEPLSVELHLGVRGKMAELLTTAGLLSARKDAKGYTLLNQPVHFGGTLQHPDSTQWHDLLAKAAAPKPDEKKKDATPAAAQK